MAFEDHLRNAKVASDRTDLVLEQLAKRFDELEVHLFRQAADIVMCLDRDRSAAERDRFDHVRIKRALNEPLNIADPLCLSVEDVDELSTDRLTFLLRINYAVEHTVKLS